MKQVTTWLNEEEYKQFLKLTERNDSSPYKFTKQLVLESMGESKKEFEIKMTIIYGYVLYSLVCATIILVF